MKNNILNITKKISIKLILSFLLICLFALILLIISKNFTKNSNFINIKNNKIQNIENIKKSIVKIIPENQLVNYSSNPHGINKINEYGIGTGFFVNKNNEIITANHVVSNSNINYYIITSDNNKYIADIISRDFKNDIAILKINSNNKYNYLNINKNLDYSTQDKIFSFGINPESLELTYISGKITDKNKKLDNISNLIEFTPQISKGFSGGPILNSNYDVIGLNYAINNGNSYGVKIN